MGGFPETRGFYRQMEGAAGPSRALEDVARPQHELGSP